MRLLTSQALYVRPGWGVLRTVDRLKSDPTRNIHTDTGFPKYPTTAWATDLMGDYVGEPEVMIDREDDAKAALWSLDPVVRDAAIAELKRLLTQCRKASPGTLFGYYDLCPVQDFDHSNPDHIDEVNRKSFALLSLCKAVDTLYISLYCMSEACSPHHPVFWLTRVVQPMHYLTGKPVVALVADRSNEDFNRTIEDDSLLETYIRAIARSLPPGSTIAYWNENIDRGHPDPEARSIRTMQIIERAVA